MTDYIHAHRLLHDTILKSKQTAHLPVMNDAACDARNSTTDATSSTRALRPRGCWTAVIASIAARVLPSSLANLSADVGHHPHQQPSLPSTGRRKRSEEDEEEEAPAAVRSAIKQEYSCNHRHDMNRPEMSACTYWHDTAGIA